MTELSESHSSESKGFPWVAPLYHFISDIELEKLSERICLRRIGAEEFSTIRKAVEKLHGMYVSIFDVQYALESDMKNSLQNFSDIVLALRLLKAGEVKAPYAYKLGERATLSATGNLYFELNPLATPYFLHKEEIADFKVLWKNVQNLTSKPHLAFSLQIFNATYEKVRFEEKIVDYIIAFESIVFHEEKKSIEPAGKVIGIAIGMLLGMNQRERTAIKKKIEKAYEVRNAKVHGNTERLERYNSLDLEQLCTEVEDYLRRALRKFVEE